MTTKTKTRLGTILILYFCLFINCHKKQACDTKIVETILTDKDNFFYLDTNHYPENRKNLPIGIFDSGTGGLTVLEQILSFDEYNNNNHEHAKGGDGINDFKTEYFIYLGDQANMPYGNYARENKVSLLQEHIIKDVQFLMGNKYYLDARDKNYQTDKNPVKAIVIACNTATAFGKDKIEKFLQQANLNLKVIGVIDAGARAALDVFKPTTNGSIAVLATAGTVSSQGYIQAIQSERKSRKYSGNINIFQQAGIGIAGAIDGSIEYISPGSAKPRTVYQGPDFNHTDAKIKVSILKRYGFDWNDNKILYTGTTNNPTNIQINSVDNYIYYHLVSLMEKIVHTQQAPPLKAIILGCTHYPYYIDVFKAKLEKLYNYKENGHYVYRKFMEPDIELIDPAQNTALELYEYLTKADLFDSLCNEKSEFYTSVPNLLNKNTDIDSMGIFTYNYKYGRDVGHIQEYVKRVPFSRKSIPAETANRLEGNVPLSFHLIKKFNQSNSKMENFEQNYKF